MQRRTHIGMSGYAGRPGTRGRHLARSGDELADSVHRPERRPQVVGCHPGGPLLPRGFRHEPSQADRPARAYCERRRHVHRRVRRRHRRGSGVRYSPIIYINSRSSKPAFKAPLVTRSPTRRSHQAARWIRDQSLVRASTRNQLCCVRGGRGRQGNYAPCGEVVRSGRCDDGRSWRPILGMAV